ncbi:MAG: hypothetical protein IPK16_27580 [Anaerolineales bacterium]|nr:hypothetical protein [Anaerolineales bacterium]
MAFFVFFVFSVVKLAWWGNGRCGHKERREHKEGDVATGNAENTKKETEGIVMKLTVHPDAHSFLAESEADLLLREPEASLIYGLANGARMNPAAAPDGLHLATVWNGEQLVVAALTGGHNLIVYSGVDEPMAALQLVAEDLLARGWQLPGVNGPVALSAAFAEIWQRLTGCTCSPGIAMRAFALYAVTPPPPTPGDFRLAARSDLDLVHAWCMAFYDEALHGEAGPPRERIEQSILAGDYYLWWHEGAPVAMAVTNRRTPHGISIGSVYTPPALRTRGYASACVARSASICLMPAGPSAPSLQTWQTRRRTASIRRLATGR